MKPNITNEANNEHANSNYTTFELTALAFPYLIHAFSKGIKGRFVTSVTVQRVDVESYKGLIRSVKDVDSGSESGSVAYTNADSVTGVLGFFENSLAYGDMKWRKDKYHKNYVDDPSESREGMSKIKLD